MHSSPLQDDSISVAIDKLKTLHANGAHFLKVPFEQFLLDQKLWCLVDPTRHPRDIVFQKNRDVWTAAEVFRDMVPDCAYLIKGISTGVRYYGGPPNRVVGDIDLIIPPGKIRDVYKEFLENGCRILDADLHQNYQKDGMRALSSTYGRAMMMHHELPELLFQGIEVDMNFRVLLRGNAVFEETYDTQRLEAKFWKTLNSLNTGGENYLPIEIDGIYMILHYFSEFVLNEFEPLDQSGVRLHKLLDIFLFAHSQRVNWKLFWELVDSIGCRDLITDFASLYCFVFEESTIFVPHPEAEIRMIRGGEFKSVNPGTLYHLMGKNVRLLKKNDDA